MTHPRLIEAEERLERSRKPLEAKQAELKAIQVQTKKLSDQQQKGNLDVLEAHRVKEDLRFLNSELAGLAPQLIYYEKQVREAEERHKQVLESIELIEKQREAVTAYNAAAAQLQTAIDGLRAVNWSGVWALEKAVQKLQPLYEQLDFPRWDFGYTRTAEEAADMAKKIQSKTKTKNKTEVAA